MKLIALLVFVALCGFAAASAVATPVEALDVSALEAAADAVDQLDADALLADADAEAEADAAEGDAEAEADAETEVTAADEESEDADSADAEAEAEAEAEEAEVEAETEAEGETERFRESSAVSMEAAEALALDSVLALTDSAGSLQYEEAADEERDDAEDEQATAEEQAIAASPRFAERARTVTYNEQFAKEASVYAQAAYWTTDPEQCAHKLGHTGFELVHSVKTTIFDGSALHAFTARDKTKKRLIIAFHGDVTAAALAKRLWKGKPIKYKQLCKSCKTHKYYALVNGKICPEMIASTRMLVQQNPNYEVVITGHGFGGALASMCGYEMEMARVFTHSNKRRFISYGQPRVGNCHWARKFNQIFPTAIRVTHGDDPVVHIAPCHVDPRTQRCVEVKDRKKRLWAFHNPTQVWYPRDMPRWDSAGAGDFTVCRGPNWGEDETCRSRPLGFSMADHNSYFGVNIASNCANVLGAL